MSIQISISDVRESLQVFANGNTANAYTVVKGAKALNQKDADVSANKAFKFGTFDLPNFVDNDKFVSLFRAFFAENNITRSAIVSNSAEFTIVLIVFNSTVFPQYSYARIHVYCTVPATTFLQTGAEEVAQIQEAAELEAAELENETETVALPENIAFVQTQTPEDQQFWKADYYGRKNYNNGYITYIWGSYHYSAKCREGLVYCGDVVIAQGVESGQDAYEICAEHFANWEWATQNNAPMPNEPIDVRAHWSYSDPAVCAIPKAEPIAQSVEFTKHDGQKSAIVVKTLTNSETGETFPFSKDFDSDFFCSPTSGVYVWGLYSVIIDRTYGQLIFARTKTPTSAAKRETYYFDDETLAEQFKDLYIDSLNDFCERAGIDPTEYANIILGAEEPNEEPATAPEPTLPPAKKDPYLAGFWDSIESETNPEDLENSETIISWGDYSVVLVAPSRFNPPLKIWVMLNNKQKSIDLPIISPTSTAEIHNYLKAYHEKHYTPQGLQMYDCENTDSMFFAKLETAQKQVFAFNANGIALTGVFKYDADIRTYTVVGWDNTRKEPVIMKDPQRFLILETTTAGQYSCSFLSGQNHRSLPVVASQPNVRNTGLQTARLSDAINI